jgi:diadenosine tetraphosphate (Ap4A) HIT family hydrolase
MKGSETLVHRRVEAARRGENPTVICRVASGWIVLGDDQFVPGYSLLTPDPVVPSLNDLSRQEQSQFLLDMTVLGDALLSVTDAWRINYSILGNHDHALHAHVHPRYKWEPNEFRSGPTYKYPLEQQKSVPFDAERDGGLMRAIYEALQDLGACI